MNIISNILGEAGQASLAVMKSSTVVLGVEVVSRVVEGIYQRYTGTLPRPGKSGFTRFAFKLIRPFSGVQSGHYKLPTGLLVVSAIGMGVITYLGNQLSTPSITIGCPCPVVFSTAGL